MNTQRNLYPLQRMNTPTQHTTWTVRQIFPSLGDSSEETFFTYHEALRYADDLSECIAKLEYEKVGNDAIIPFFPFLKFKTHSGDPFEREFHWGLSRSSGANRDAATGDCLPGKLPWDLLVRKIRSFAIEVISEKEPEISTEPESNTMTLGVIELEALICALSDYAPKQPENYRALLDQILSHLKSIRHDSTNDPIVLTVQS